MHLKTKMYSFFEKAMFQRKLVAVGVRPAQLTCAGRRISRFCEDLHVFVLVSFSLLVHFLTKYMQPTELVK